MQPVSTEGQRTLIYDVQLHCTTPKDNGFKPIFSFLAFQNYQPLRLYQQSLRHYLLYHLHKALHQPPQIIEENPKHIKEKRRAPKNKKMGRWLQA
jgi:hypothetical protein